MYDVENDNILLNSDETRPHPMKRFLPGMNHLLFSHKNGIIDIVTENLYDVVCCIWDAPFI